MGKRHNRARQTVPEFTSERDKGVKILINSCISEMEKIWVTLGRKHRAAGSWGEKRHEVSKFRRPVNSHEDSGR